MNPFSPRIRMAVWLVLLAAGCRSASPPVSYYTLSAQEKQANGEAPSSGIKIGIGAITLPDYLDRDQMVVRTGPHRLRIDDYHAWAAPLPRELARVLTENLMVLTGSLQIEHLPWTGRFHPDIVIGIQVFNFDAYADGQVHLSAAVRMSDRRSGTVKTLSVDLKEQTTASGYSGLVAAQSRLLGELSRRIAAALPK